MFRLIAQRLASVPSRLVSTGIPSRSMTSLHLTFASPDEVFYNNSVVRQVDVPTITGDFGVVAEHVPTLGCLKPGVITVYEEDGATKKFFVSSGSVTINDDSTMQVMAEVATSVDQLDAHAIREGLTKAQQEMATASTEKLKAEGQIMAECYEALNKAVEGKH